MSEILNLLTVYDPIQRPEMYFDHLEPHGSDPEPIYTHTGRMVDITPRWKQTCNLCGMTRYTTKTRWKQASEPYFEP
jgi:hypothetical protein